MRHSVAALLLGVLLAVMACESVPITGRSQVMMLSTSQEKQMGSEAYQEILKKSKISTDPALNEHVTRVGRRIAEATDKTDSQWEFKVIEDNQANAFCLPGGKVAVYTGILPITRADAGLAAVLGQGGPCRRSPRGKASQPGDGCVGGSADHPDRAG
jgi:predicted Zn-dependent protease